MPFTKRGKILDEQLEIMRLAWQGGPFSYSGEHFAFEDVTLSPGAYRPDGPRLWFGGQGVSPPLLRRLVRYGHGFHPVGEWTGEDLEKLAAGMAEAGRDIADLERVGGTRAVFPDDDSTADLGRADGAHPRAARGGVHHLLRQAVAVHRRRRRAPRLLS